ncbi:helix-turn-helix domain-containing protein [Desulfovibrio sp. JC010]|uniref:helix-turn-helix domain-containing protein n=1 Tax=Desulfovibrio sp. JC010 TaxID=2593641 RepID=UPI0013D7A089|nr:helix-turn-helix domain-containing protein [Desulfovibrio sp. JC010]NDV27745.1 helix-turn-helix transcriptional regulator [Desulfovibrio sp. JC010]
MSRLPVDQQAAKNAPRGQEHYWKVMQQLDCEAGFTVDAVYRKCNGPKNQVRDYIGRLHKAGFLEVVRSEKEGIITRHYYTIAKRSRFAPKVRRDGTIVSPTKREVMWRTIRMHKRVTRDDLVVWASLPEVPVKPNDAQDYLKHLTKAGYLRRNGKTYTLIKNTGPLPPKIQRIKQVFDPNLNKVVWTPKEKA